VKLFADEDNMWGKPLGLKPVVGLGLISYSAYLWHQPIFAFASVRYDVPSASVTMLGLCVASLGVAYASWRFIERPLRDRKRSPVVLAFPSALAMIGVFVAANISTRMSRGFPARFPTGVATIVKLAQDKNPRPECAPDVANFLEPDRSRTYNFPLVAKVAIWGDSHAHERARAFERTRQVAESQSYRTQGTQRAGLPADSRRILPRIAEKNCSRYAELAYNYLLRHSEITTVVVMARWSLYLNGSQYDNGEGGRIDTINKARALPLGSTHAFVDDPERPRAVGSLLRAQIEALVAQGKNVTVVYSVPDIGWTMLERWLFERFEHETHPSEPLSISYGIFKKRALAAETQLDSLHDSRNLLRIRPEALFCNTFVADRCLAEVGNKPLYFDDNHLNSIGGEMLSKAIVDAMIQRGWL
jgi:hypothetical protein